MKRIFLYFISIVFICVSTVSHAQSIKDKHAASNSDITSEVHSLSKSCWNLREINSDSALTLGFKALELAEKHEMNKEIGQICNYIGVIYFHYQYKYKQSIPYFQQAMRVSLLLKDSLQLAYAYNNLGDVYLTSGNIPLALQYGQTSLEIFRHLDHKSGIAYGLINLGELFLKTKEFDKSLEYFQEATNIRELLDSTARIGYVFYSLAQTHKEAGNLDSAMIQYHNALSHNYISQNHRYVSRCLDGIAGIYYIQENYENAIQYYKDALDWNRKHNNPYNVIDNYLGLALVYAKTNKIDEGEKLLAEALKLALGMDNNAQIIYAYKSYIEFYKILEDYENVTRIFDTFFLQYDSIFSAQQIEIVNELETVFSVEQELIKTEQELKTHKLLRGRLIVIIILMVGVISILIWQYQSNIRMNKQLEEMNHTKDKLFSVISHDLKNPFNSLIGLSEILQKSIEDKDYDQAHELAGYLNKASVQGLNLLTNLLHWSSSQSGKIRFNPERFSIDMLFDELKKLYTIEAEKYKINLIFDNNIKNEISADRDILKIILINLITNALKYTPENGTIEVRAFQENNLLKLQVKDSGLGMSDQVQNEAFNKINFVSSKRGIRNEKGSGLGLSIVRELTQIHNGKIRLNSKEGVGSSFEIEIPYITSD